MKAIIPVAGLGTRFLPLSKVLSKELWPLVDKPVIHYIVEEIKKSGIEEIVFVVNPDRKNVLDYFQKSLKIESILKKRKKELLLKELEGLEQVFKNISFSYVLQKKPLGAAHAVFQAKDLIKKHPSIAVWGDDVIESKIPCILQLQEIFKTTQKPIVALSKVSNEKIPFYGIAKVEKISHSLYKIKGIVEKPSIENAPSNLAIVGRYINTPEVFEYLEKTNFEKQEDISFSEILGKMIDDGKTVYGYEFEGKWLECGNKLAYLKSNLYLSLKDPRFNQQLKNFLNK